MHILVLQHIAIEDPGFIKPLMEKDRWQLTTVELDEGERIPNDLSAFDAMICMGGPMDTFMEDEYTWLVEEKKRIKEFVVDLEKPFLGFCLGAQLLGEVIGGQVAKSVPAEIGVLDVHFRQAVQDSLIVGFPDTIKTVQWHSYEVQGLEDDADVCLLASSPTTAYQFFRYKQHAYGIQFHIEVKQDTVREWGKIPEYKAALENSLGADALPVLNQQAQACMPMMNEHCTLLYENFKQLLSARS